MEDQVTLKSEYSEKKILLSKNQFIFLCFISWGLYSIWWTYKAWKIFQVRDSYDILPAWRTVFSIFFLIGLFNRIKVFSKQTGYPHDYLSVALFLGILAINALSYLPDPFWLLGLFSIFCYVPPFEALNYAIENSDDYDAEKQTGFNRNQTILIVIGSIFWFLVVLGLLFGETVE